MDIQCDCLARHDCSGGLAYETESREISGLRNEHGAPGVTGRRQECEPTFKIGQRLVECHGCGSRIHLTVGPGDITALSHRDIVGELPVRFMSFPIKNSTCQSEIHSGDFGDAEFVDVVAGHVGSAEGFADGIVIDTVKTG